MDAENILLAIALFVLVMVALYGMTVPILSALGT
jgi:hypothetical protein